ncbi:MAG TPA: RNA methyltransferase [Gemmatimonadaceae bacterium]|nr:RNA methyltransferase [Gemmatimonadaceae bacterium]
MRLLTLARDLRRRKAREKHSLFVAEGVRSVEELLRSGLPIDGALVAPQLATAPRGQSLRSGLEAAGVEVAEVSEKDFRGAAETESPQGVIAIARIPARTLESLEIGARCRLLVLDALQDPGNVGTIVRTAAALGATATIALPGTVDLWNPKVIRSSMGAQFVHPVVHTSVPELLAYLERAGVELWCADTAGEAIGTALPPERLAIALGNEGAGLSPGIRAAARKSVSLPISSTVESLNVAVAAGIILYHLR